jgi:hypothetical protein
MLISTGTPDDICAMVATPEVIHAIVDRFGDGDSDVRQAGVQALVELAKLGNGV